MKMVMNRRVFFRIAAASALAMKWIPALGRPESRKSPIVYISDRGYRRSGEITIERLQFMLDEALVRLTDAAKAEDAWRSLFSPEDVIGIKVNCLAGMGISSSTKVVEVIARALLRAGIPSDRIIVWDRTNRDLKSAGFAAAASSKLYRCFGTDQVGFDVKLYEKDSVGSLVSSILTSMCTAIVNVPVLKDHGITGVSMGLKNYFGAIHNPNKYHPNGGNPFIADLNSMDIIRSRERLIVCDCLRAQYNGGPAYVPRWNWAEGALLVARDPVALDFTGFNIIEDKRRQMGLPPFEVEKRFPEYIFSAAKKHQIGNAAADRIEVIREEI